MFFLFDQCTGFSSLACLECSISRDVAHMSTDIRLHHSLKIVNQKLCQMKKIRCRKLMKLTFAAAEIFFLRLVENDIFYGVRWKSLLTVSTMLDVL